MKELLKDNRLIAIVCDDMGEEFRLRYYFDGKDHNIFFKELRVPKESPVVESLAEEFPPADFYEREIHDFYGVEFEGNKNLHLKLFLPEDWKGKPPMRRDESA